MFGKATYYKVTLVSFFHRQANVAELQDEISKLKNRPLRNNEPPGNNSNGVASVSKFPLINSHKAPFLAHIEGKGSSRSGPGKPICEN